MSDPSDPNSPPPPGPGSEPTPPPPPPSPPTPAGPHEPTSAFPGVPDAEPIAPVADPTERMPSVPPTAVGGVPPIYPPDNPPFPMDGEDEPTPWYKQPGPVALIIIVVLAILVLLAWLVLGGSDDDEPSVDSSRLIIELTDETGQPIDRPISATVVGPAGAEEAYAWVRPDDAIPGAAADETTGTDGRVDFEWAVDETVADPTTWAATVTVLDTFPAGWTAPGPVVDCALERADDERDDATVTMNIAPSTEDRTIDGFTVYTFPSHQFVMGDTVTCDLVYTAPAPVDTTVVDTTSVDTTTVETTVVDTTIADTTIAETTTSTTTTTSTSTTTTVAPTTTIPVVTVPPQPAATLWDIIESNPDLSGIRDWITDSGLVADFQDPNADLTLLAPSNEAITNAATIFPGIDFTDPANLVLLVNTHLDDTQSLLIADIAALPTIEVVEPGPHDVDAADSPPVVCQLDCASTPQAQFLVTDVEAANGVIQVIDRVLLPVALTP